MKVLLIYTVNAGGPIRGRKLYDPWPFEMPPRVKDTLALGTLDEDGAMFWVEHVIFCPEQGVVEIYDHMEDVATTTEGRERAAAIKMQALRRVGFDFGPVREWEKEHQR